eukprot:1146837-Pelagomonas_calceolata.AAC.8
MVAYEVIGSATPSPVASKNGTMARYAYSTCLPDCLVIGCRGKCCVQLVCCNAVDWATVSSKCVPVCTFSLPPFYFPDPAKGIWQK